MKVKEKVSEESMAIQCLSLDTILEQLSELKDYSESKANEECADPAYEKDTEALEAAIAILDALQEEGICDADGVRDLMHDYTGMAAETRELRRKFCTPANVIRKDGVFHCPECNSKTPPRHSHCHRCGRKLGGW